MLNSSQSDFSEPQCDLLLVDGKNLFWRAASSSDLTADGKQTAGIYTFLRALIKIHEKFGGVIVICWEGGKRRTMKRVEMYPEYKLRKSDPEREEILKTVFSQLDRLIKLLGVLGITQAKAPGWEADDAMATLARRTEKKGYITAIFSADSDMFQCVTDSTFVVKPISKGIEIIDSDKVQEHLGVHPDQVPLLKALSGDPSDGIPGVNGIGKVGAAKLIEKLSSYTNIIAATKADQKPDISRFGNKAWEALKISAENGELELWLKLAQVNPKADVEITLSEYDGRSVIRELISLRFQTMLRLRERDQLRRLTGMVE